MADGIPSSNPRLPGRGSSGHRPRASIEPDGSSTVGGPRGVVAHRGHLAQTERLERRLYEVRPGVWTLVGNGLSNQSFIEGPDGLIAIDTGESVEEMADALAEVRTVTDAPVVAVLYTHFHYVSGTTAVLADTPGAGLSVETLPVWGHEGIVGNLERVGSEIAPAASRGLVHQFGLFLPDEGPDALVNVGLGMEFRRADHAPFTSGFLPPTETISGPRTATIAGLRVEFTPAPSDADDSLTIWFPELSVCVNNIFWPALFNVFAIRGEEYRDPRILLDGLDHMISLGAEHLLGTHGPPLSGAGTIRSEVTTYRDSIQFLWDQTVRGLNRGLTLDELIGFVQLPDHFDSGYRTGQYYGLAEHHVRQIHNGLRGWFDGYEPSLLAVPGPERAARLIEGFGGADEVRSQARAALAGDDIRWALELATWLVRGQVDEHGRGDGDPGVAGTEADRALLASVLRAAAQRTTSANLRNHCLTRALELEGSLDLSRFRTHRFGRGEVLANPPGRFVHTLRVLLDPDRAGGIDDEVGFEFDDGSAAGLHVRHSVAVPTDGGGTDLVVTIDRETWADVLSNRLTMAEAADAGRVTLTGDRARIGAVLACFDHPGLGLA